MSNTTANLRRKIDSAEDLQSVVRTMKALAASSIGQYEHAVRALSDYHHTVELGLGVCIRSRETSALPSAPQGQPEVGTITAIVFGSDQGLVGQFNDAVVDFAIETLSSLPGHSVVWAVGERIHARLVDAGLVTMGLFDVPNSVKAIAPLVGQIQVDTEANRIIGDDASTYVFHNQPQSAGMYAPVSQQLLPLDAQWQHRLANVRWPTEQLPEVIRDGNRTLRLLVREYLFISLFRACAESLASENASRLTAMQRADRNIGELLESLRGTFHRSRQSAIDEELFDVLAGFEALNGLRGSSSPLGRPSRLGATGQSILPSDLFQARAKETSR